MSSAVDYKSSLSLPRTSFPMRGNMAKREPELLERWSGQNLYERIVEQSRGRPRFVLHDGPPYANGHIHYGHILNKVLKDIVVKYKAMSGHHTVYLPGWDCHGLPIEMHVERDLGPRKAELSVAEFRAACRDYALRFVEVQREEFKRLGVFGQWAQPYLTLTPQYEATIVRELARFAEQGYLYRGTKPVYWDSTHKTALAEAEVEYRERTSPSIYVKFRFLGDPALVAPQLAGRAVHFVIWTTTPWTLPANLAIALNPRAEYVAVEHGGEALVLARELVADVARQCEIEALPVLAEVDPARLEREQCQHPFIDRTSMIVFADYVTLDTGTGCVHTAPGHGHDDFITGQKYGLPTLAPVDDEGRFTAEVPDYAGQHVFATNGPIVDRLADSGALLNPKGQTVTHSYPHGWRSKEPVIFRATPQWFARIDHLELRKRALQQVDQTRWIPPWGHARIHGMIENRPDWCLSRQRMWGVPIPALYCERCGATVASGELMKHVAELFADGGSDIWFSRETEDLLPPGFACPECGEAGFRKERDIVDVWFESGVSWAAVCEPVAELWPIDLYLEGSDQHRGWFHSALLTGVATRDAAPYRAVLTHGFVIDEKGQPYSKSLKNFIPPERVIGSRGAEIFRLWTAYVDYRNDMPFSEGILTQLSDSYRKIRNTCRFLLGNLDGYVPPDPPQTSSDGLDEARIAATTTLDRWALSRTNELLARCHAAYESYEFHQVFRALIEFCAVDLSAFYLDVVKDRLYCSSPGERRTTQAVLYRVGRALTTLMAPIFAFTAEDVWSHLPRLPDDPDSVHLAQIPPPGAIDATLLQQVEGLRALRDRVLKALEPFRAQKHHSLDARVVLRLSAEDRALVEGYAEDLADLFIVSDVVIEEGAAKETEVEVIEAVGVKCPRCWKRSPGCDDASRPDICPRCHGVLDKIGWAARGPSEA